MSSIYDYMTNILVYDKNYKRIGTLSNGGANPQAPYYDDLFIQELDTGADTFQFSAISNKYTQDLLEIGNHVGFIYKNRFEVFTITSLEYSHYEGYKTIGVYAEGIGFELLDVFMERPPIQKYPGNDSDGDGDDNTDDEYADVDDIYLDENGNIIYDKNGSGPPKKEDVTIDGDGNIIYKANKKNEKNDSLEFKNISYPTFLNILLKNTGWSFVCQPGLESVKHNISVKYDTNIYAILQDSMQAFRGVELEFSYEGTPQNGGNSAAVRKVIKAYKDGGRGSFVGKRFEYGTNVRGITKTQEVTDSEDDAVLFVDNIGVEVYYDIDFALKSAEVPDLEIGDTHYVIDRDFCPPMTIKARIGKIEVSFSDPTKNKITVANNKKIRGAAIDEDDIKDTVKNLDDIINDGIDDYNDIYGDDDIISGDYIKNHDPVAYLGNLEIEEWITVGGFDAPGGEGVGLRLTNNMAETIIYPDAIETPEVRPHHIDVDTVAVNENLDAQRIRVYGDDPITGGLHIFGKAGLHVSNYIQFADGSKLTSAKGLSSGGSNPGGSNPDSGDDGGDSGNSGDNGTSNPEFNDITCRLVEAKQVSTEKLIIDREDGEGASADIYGELYVTEKIKSKLIETNTIKFSDGTTMTTAGSSGDLNKYIDVVEKDHEYDDIVEDFGAELHIKRAAYFDGPIHLTGNMGDEIGAATNSYSSIFGAGQIETMILNCDAWRPNDIYKDVTFYGDVIVDGTLSYKSINPLSDISKKENIRYIDEPVKRTNDDSLNKADLHDFIVNQVNICEYNFIGDDSDKIGFIANDYEGTKVGDKIISRQDFKERNDKGDVINTSELLVYDSDNLLFATIGALQEEVRIRDAQIASLEARLAAIEEMLNNK